MKETKSTFKMPSVMSKKAHEKKRALLLVCSVNECHLADKRCPDEWLKELIDLNKTFAK